MLRPDRRRRSADPTLPHRMALLAVGAVLGLAGMLWQRPILTSAGIIVLAAGLLLGVVSRRRAQNIDRESPEE